MYDICHIYEYSLFYRALLQKRPMFLGSLLIVATPYQVSFVGWRIFIYIHRYSYVWHSYEFICMTNVIHFNTSEARYSYVGHVASDVLTCLFYRALLQKNNMYDICKWQTSYMSFFIYMYDILLQTYWHVCLFYRALLQERPVFCHLYVWHLASDVLTCMSLL